jgi:hypothetical protein
MTRAEVEARLGIPSRKVGSAEVDIWSYDLRRLGDTLYSIRVAFDRDEVSQAYLGMELLTARPCQTSLRDSPHDC